MTLNAPEKGQRSERLIEQKSTFIIGITMSIFIWPARTKKIIQPPDTGSCYVARLMPDEEMLKLMIVHNGRRDILTPRATCAKKGLDDSQDCPWIQKTQNTSQFEKTQTNPRIFHKFQGISPPKTSPKTGISPILPGWVMPRVQWPASRTTSCCGFLAWSEGTPRWRTSVAA